MLDELTAIGKMEILEEALAHIAGYGIRAYLVVQDTRQLYRTCATARDEQLQDPGRLLNLPETAELLSRMTAGRRWCSGGGRARGRGAPSARSPTVWPRPRGPC